MPRPPTCWNALAPSTELPLVTLLPRAWIGFGKAPWRCVGLASALLLSAIGPALLGEDLRQLGFGWLGDLMVAASLVLPLLPLLALLRLADQLLPAESASKPPLSWGWLVRRAADAVLAVQPGAGLTSAGASPPQSTAGDGSQPATGAPEGLKVLALLGLLIGINLLGLIGASLGLLFSLPFSALILMACCRTQTPCNSVSRRNMLPT